MQLTLSLLSSSLSWQALLVDVRGHGESELSDYPEPHTLSEVCGDIVEVIMCYDTPPKAVLATGGALSQAIALSYLESTLKGTAVPSTLSTEASSRDALFPPQCTILCDYSGPPSPSSVEEILSSIMYVLGKVGVFLREDEDLLSKTVSRADLRKHLLLSKGLKGQKTAVQSLLDALANFDALQETDKKRFEALELPPEEKADGLTEDHLDLFRSLSSELGKSPLCGELSSLLKKYSSSTSLVVASEDKLDIVSGSLDGRMLKFLSYFGKPTVRLSK